MTEEKSQNLYSKLYEKFMELQNWSHEEERLNREFIESIENKSRK